MAQVRLDLRSKTDAEIIELAQHHITEMTGNANFPTPTPSEADFAALVAVGVTSMAAVDSNYTAWRTSIATKDVDILAIRNALTGRAGYVDASGGGDEAKILSSGFTTRAPATPATPVGLPAQPGNLIAAMGSLEGTMELDWENVCGAAGEGPWSDEAVKMAP